MKKHSIIASIAGCLALASVGIQAAVAQTSEFYPQWVEYRDDHISFAFDQIPVVVALQAFRQKTGFQFTLPSSADSKLLNLRLERSPLEPAVYSLLSNIGFRNFALIYDERGRPNRAVVLGSQVDRAAVVVADSSQTAEPVVQPLDPEERETLQKGLERWGDLKQEERGRIEDRLKTLPPSEEREQLVKEYGRKLLGIQK
jgi:hypothetical protein